jgi:hypothetical protein
MLRIRITDNHAQLRDWTAEKLEAGEKRKKEVNPHRVETRGFTTERPQVIT